MMQSEDIKEIGSPPRTSTAAASSTQVVLPSTAAPGKTAAYYAAAAAAATTALTANATNNDAVTGTGPITPIIQSPVVQDQRAELLAPVLSVPSPIRRGQEAPISVLTSEPGRRVGASGDATHSGLTSTTNSNTSHISYNGRSAGVTEGEEEPLDAEDLPMLEQIVPLRNIKHGWANIAAWASAAAVEMGADEVVASLRRTAGSVSGAVASAAAPAWEAATTAATEAVEAAEGELLPTLENMAQTVSSGWDCLTSACLHGTKSVATASAMATVGGSQEGEEEDDVAEEEESGEIDRLK